MPHTTSPQEAVSRLKELLFERESREIDALAARIAALQEQAGTDEHLRRSIARVLDGALRDAEAVRHRELADAMSPMVVRTLRAEMKSADMQDQIAGLMYPRMGEMVGRFVASAVRDMMQEINSRLEAGIGRNRVVLWLRSRASGRSMAELALADTQRLEVDEIYLIRRGSGELIHRWQRADREAGAPAGESKATGGNRDTLVSGFLTAITAFAEEAFDAGKESLRTLDLDQHRLYIRGAPAHLLAAKCRGTTPAGVDRLFDDELIRVLAEHRALEQAAPAGGRVATAEHERLLGALAARLEAGSAERARAVSQGHGLRLLRAVVWLVGVPLALVVGWQLYVSWVTSELQSRAEKAVAGVPAIVGYPVKVHAERGGQRLWVTGLVPDETSRRLVVTALKEMAPTVELATAISVIPRPDVDGRVGAAALQRSVAQAMPRLAALVTDIAVARPLLKEAEDLAALAAAEDAAKAATRQLAAIDAEAGALPPEADLIRLADALARAAGRLATLSGAASPTKAPPPRSAVEAVEAAGLAADYASRQIGLIEQRRALGPLARRLDTVSEQLARSTEAVERRAEQRVATLDRRLEERLAALESRLIALTPKPPSPQETLAAFVARKAIFFANDTEYRDAAGARAMLDALAPMIPAAGVALRVVGYTDEIGTAGRNLSLAQARADKVADDLVARGVPRGLIIAVGRPGSFNIAPVTGPGSPNRRVELEIAFPGEKDVAP